MDFLGLIPLDMDIRKSSDDGTPIVASQPDSPLTKAYVEIADKLLEKLL
jgi:ATP-binding protein involved in chromosome partitioning